MEAFRDTWAVFVTEVFVWGSGMCAEGTCDHCGVGMMQGGVGRGRKGQHKVGRKRLQKMQK